MQQGCEEGTQKSSWQLILCQYLRDQYGLITKANKIYFNLIALQQWPVKCLIIAMTFFTAASKFCCLIKNPLRVSWHRSMVLCYWTNRIFVQFGGGMRNAILPSPFSKRSNLCSGLCVSANKFSILLNAERRHNTHPPYHKWCSNAQLLTESIYRVLKDQNE